MFTIRNALRNISRSKGRSILIGIIITIIAFSICIGLSIRQAAVDSKTAALSELELTAQISLDREKMMKQAQSSSSSSSRKSSLQDGDQLSLSQLKKYAKASSVKNFYYTLTASVDGAGSLEAYSSSSSGSSSEKSSGDGMSMGEFTLTGYSSDDAMTDFTDGTCKITSGSMFDEGTSKMVCVISDELAEYNDLEVGDTIKIANPNDSSEKYKLKIVGIYKNSNSSQQAMQNGPMGSDPANSIYASYGTVNKIVSSSSSANDDSSDAISGRLNGTYVVGTLANYKKFKKEVSEIGLSSKYTVSSQDIENYERSAAPLENLANFAKYFLIVIICVGAVILIVMNIFSTRERKYEIGVLTAIGMKKKNVAKLFVTEILALTLAGVIVGGGIGAATSVPVTRALLRTTAATQQTEMQDRNDAFGRQDQQSSSDSSTDSDSGSSQNEPPSGSGPSGSTNQDEIISNISNSVDCKVVLELLGCCILLAMAAGAVSVVTIMRYEPVQILTNRD